MVDYQDEIKELEKEIANTKYNKRTQGHIGLVKAKIAKLKEKDAARGGGGGGEGFAVRKSGDGTAILLGFPSVGKSTLLNSITNANSEVGAYAFTTLTVVPGLLEYNDAKIQVLDVPGIVRGAASGRGRGREVLSTMHSADLVLIILDINQPQHLDVIKKEIYDAHIRINQRPPDVKIIKTSRDGIKIGTTVKLTHLDEHTIKAILKEFRINNADLVIREDITIDQLIDVIEGNKKYVPSALIVNKVDMATPEQIEKVKKEFKPDLMISADKKVHLDELKDLIYSKLNIIRVYCKEYGKKADLTVPLILHGGDTIEDMCRKLHKDFVSQFKSAKVWGKSSKYPGQKFLIRHKLADKDIVEINVR